MQRECDSSTISIYMAGDKATARQVCREFCMEVGFCVSFFECGYIYTGGEEEGFEVRCINYARFPAPLPEMWAKALALADRLRTRLCQHSYSVVGPDKSLWNTVRE